MDINVSILSNLGVSEFMLENRIQTKIALFAKADERKKADEKTSQTLCCDLISRPWKMESVASNEAVTVSFA